MKKHIILAFIASTIGTFVIVGGVAFIIGACLPTDAEVFHPEQKPDSVKITTEVLPAPEESPASLNVYIKDFFTWAEISNAIKPDTFIDLGGLALGMNLKEESNTLYKLTGIGTLKLVIYGSESTYFFICKRNELEKTVECFER